jgi:hypothetical protein
MSRHRYTQSTELDQIMYDYNTLPEIEFEDLYGIEILEDGSVYDPVVNKSYNTFDEWSFAQIEEEDESEYSHLHQVSKRYEED